MNIIRRQRETGMSNFREVMDDLFNRFLEGEGTDFPWMTKAYFPAVDLAEKEDKIIIKAEVPGMKPEDIELSVHGNTLYISGEKKEEKEDKTQEFYHMERRYGQFRRAVALPSNVDADKIEAVYRDGVLAITLPKMESEKPKRIKVNTAKT